MYFSYSSLGKIVSFYGKKTNYFTCFVFFVVLPYSFARKRISFQTWTNSQEPKPLFFAPWSRSRSKKNTRSQSRVAWEKIRSRSRSWCCLKKKSGAGAAKIYLKSKNISCGFLKYAWCIFKATRVRVYKLCIKTTYQMLKHIPITLNQLNKRKKQNVWTIALYHQSMNLSRLFCEFKIPWSLITQQEFFGKKFLPGFWRPGKF